LFEARPERRNRAEDLFGYLDSLWVSGQRAKIYQLCLGRAQSPFECADPSPEPGKAHGASHEGDETHMQQGPREMADWQQWPEPNRHPAHYPQANGG
jgi:hypothetical protein